MKYLLIFFFNLIIVKQTFAMSESYEKKFFWGCYPGSKLYLGSEKAKLYCSCTVKELSQKFTDDEMDVISLQSSSKQLEAFDFASSKCGRNLD